MSATPPTGYDSLRGVVIRAIQTCPPGQETQLRERITQFAAGLDADDLAIFETVIAELNEGPDVRIERELAQLLAEFLKDRPSHQ